MIRPPLRLASSQSYIWAVTGLALAVGGVPGEQVVHDSVMAVAVIGGLLLWARLVFSELDPKHDSPGR